MSTLIIKLGAAGDVVRTTSLLHRLDHVDWLTTPENMAFVEDATGVRVISSEDSASLKKRRYDLVINLEDSREIAALVRSLSYERLFGAYLNGSEQLVYTENSRPWFDLSLISRFGRTEADRLKLNNRKSYQELLFSSLGFDFCGDPYVISDSEETQLSGDVAIAPKAGPAWPIKNWPFYEQLADRLRSGGLAVNFLPFRETIRQHLGDIQNHRCLVSGDSLPMHLALGSGVRCVSLFTCTSPWEIYDYGVQSKIISPRLEEFFYCREDIPEAASAITVDEVEEAVIQNTDCRTQKME